MGRVRGTWVWLGVAAMVACLGLPSQVAAAAPQTQTSADSAVTAVPSGPKPKKKPARANPARELGAEHTIKIAQQPKHVPRVATPTPSTWSPLGPQPIISGSSGSTWGTVSGRVTALALDPTSSLTVYAGTAGGGVWKSTDGGITWAPMSDTQMSLSIGAVAVDPNHHLVVFAGTGEGNRCGDCLIGSGLLKSTDGGSTWNIYGPNFPGHYFNAIAVDRTNSNRVLAATTAGLFLSTDGGTTWSPNASLANLSSLIEPRVDSLFQDLSNPSSWWASVSERCFDTGFIAHSSDGGNNWSAVRRMSSFAGFPRVTRIAMAGGRNGVLYAQVAACASATYSDGQLVAILKSADSGSSWSVITSAPGLVDPFGFSGSFYQGWYDNVVAVDPTNANHAIFAGITMLATRDGGASFSDVAQPYYGGSVHPDVHAVVFTGAPDTVYAGNDGGAWKSTDLGGTAAPSDWTNLNSTLAITTFYSGTAVDATHLIGGTQDDGTVAMVLSGPAPPAWNQQMDGDGTYTQVVPGSSTYYAAQPGLGIVRGDYTTPGVFRLAAPCDNSASTAACNDPTSFVAPFGIDPASTPAATTIYGGTNRIYRSTTGGVPAGLGWTAISPDLTTGTDIFLGGDTLSAIAVGPNGLVLTGSWGGKVFESTNANSANPTWTDLSSGLPAFSIPSYNGRPWISSLSIGGPNQFYVALGNGQGVFEELNQLWNQIGDPSGALVNSVAADPGDPNIVYAGTDVGPFVCSHCVPLTSWAPLGTGIPRSPVDAITVAGDMQSLVAWTHGRGAWILPKSSSQTVTFDRNPLDFGTILPGDPLPQQRSVTARATLNQPNVSWQGATITGPNAGDFSITGNGCSGSGIACIIIVALTPTATGLRTATLNLFDDAVNSPQSVSLRGYFSTVGMSFSTSQVNLGTVQLGSTSGPMSLTINALGAGPLSLGTLTISESDGGNVTIPAGTDHCSGQMIAGGSSCTVQFTMAPTLPGSVLAYLNVPNNAGIVAQAVRITGFANGPYFTWQGFAYDFGGMNVGVPSQPLRFTMTNLGNQDLVVTSATLVGGSPSNFTITSDSCLSGPIHPDAACEVDVVFQADAIIARSTTLTFNHNAPTSLKTLPLAGHGVNTSATVSSSALDFGPVEIGTGTPPPYKTVTLTSNGPDLLSRPVIAFTGTNASDFFEAVLTCNGPIPITPGESCTFYLGFAPGGSGGAGRSAVLNIYDSTGTHTINVSGTATTPGFSFSPNPLAFGTVTAGSPLTLTETVNNTGTGQFTMAFISLGIDFAMVADNCTGVSVAAGHSCTVVVKFDPSASADRSTTFSFFANNALFRADLPVTAIGSAPAISSANVLFPDTPVGGTSAPVTVTVNNSGTATWNVGSVVSTGLPNFALAGGGSDHCSGTTVAPGGSCTLAVVFKPAAATFYFSNLMSFGNFRAGFTFMQGTGLAPMAKMAAGLDFGSLEVGQIASRSLTIANTGNAHLHVTGVRFITGNGDFSLVALNSCGDVAPNGSGSCSLSLQFKPSVSGGGSAIMALVDDEPNPAVITLSGTGIPVTPCTFASLTSTPAIPEAAGTQVTFTAAASPCVRPEFEFWLMPPGGAWTKQQAYSALNTWTWNSTAVANGAYQVKVNARDQGSSASFEGTTTTSFQIVSPACASAVVTPDHAGPQPPGANVTFTASRPGCPDATLYQFWIVGNGLGFTIVQPFSSAPSWKVDFSRLNGAGTYSIDVWIKEPSSTNSYDTFALGSLVVGGCTSASMSPNTGNGVFTVTAAGPACTTPEFKYWMVGNGRDWFVAHDWTSANTLNPSTQVAGLTAGTYSLDVWVRQQGSSKVSGYLQTWALSTVVVPGGICGGATLAATETSPASTGATVHFTATGGTCALPQYEYWLYPGSAGHWQWLQGFGSSPTLTWNTAGLGEGTYSIVAWVKRTGSAATYDTYSLLSFTLGGCDSLTLASDVSSPEPLGRTVNFTATSHGACATPVYEYWILPSGGKWILAQPWSTRSTFRWENLGAGYNTFAVVVWVKPAGSSPAANYETYDLVSFALTG